MYERLKSIAKRTIPDRMLDRYDAEFRRLNAVWYRGNEVSCRCCGGNFSRWIILENKELLCPRCGSLPRTRRLYGLLLDSYLKGGMRMLHFSPSRTLSKRLRKRSDITYDSTDFVGEFKATYRFDITAIDLPAATYDLIVCFHVLEHILDDRKAMLELHRVIKPGGTVLIQTPFREGDIYEDDSITSPEDRLAAFGQADHVREYSVDGLAGRLREAGFTVSPTLFEADERSGLRGGECVLVCRK